MRLTDEQLHALKDRHPVSDLAGQWVKLRRKRKGEFVGPCPICSDDPQSKTAGRFECDADKWVCAVCADGGDVIALVMRREGVDFAGAIERLGGGRAEVITPEIAERRGLQAFQRLGVAADMPPAFPDGYDDRLRAAYVEGWRKAARRANYAAMARERERTRLHAFWRETAPLAQAEGLHHYFRSRGLDLPPDRARLGWHPSMPYFADGREHEPLLIHRGPAMLAPILAPDGRFSGLHITWLDPRTPKGKAELRHPVTGEALPAKKVRGSKAGGYLDLGGAPAASARRMIAGEGIETVLAVYSALRRAGRDLSATMLRAGVDLGNLAGRAVETVDHPELKTGNGRPQRVPGLEPDLASPAMPVPDEIDDLVLLGDGDSDPFLTRMAMERAAARHARPGRLVRIRFAPAGQDFNDMIARERA